MTNARFGRISDIEPGNPATWQGKTFLTFDIDWACDDIIDDTIKLVESAGVAATWFATHDTPILKRLRNNSTFEIGIHPNFNFLLEGDSRNGSNAAEVVDRLMEFVPEARAVRSHCMTQSSTLLDLFKRRGLTHDCNHFVPAHIQSQLTPWALWNGLIRVPYFWEDDIHCIYADPSALEVAMRHTGLRVFDFHPIHIFLNTEDMSRYERTRTIHRNPAELLSHRNSNNTGARDHLIQLLKENA